MSVRRGLCVNAGPHDRRSCPVSIPLPVPLERPTLYRAGRNRPIACQLEHSADGARLWWLVESAAAGESQEYTLALGERQRQPPARVTFEAGAAGWAASRHGQKVAEILCPAEGAPRLTLLDGRQRQATFVLRPWSAQGNARPPASIFHRVRRSEPQVASGPVFASLATLYDYVDDDAHTVWSETYHLRIYDGPDELVIADLSVGWHTGAGAIALQSDVTGSSSLCPVARLEFGPIADRKFVVSPGWMGAAEIDHRPGPWLLATGSPRMLGVMTNSPSFGFPPRWLVGPDQSVEVAPSMPRHAGRPLPVRLALGENLEVHYRLVSFAAKDPVRLLNERYLDFDCPPTVELAEPLTDVSMPSE